MIEDNQRHAKLLGDTLDEAGLVRGAPQCELTHETRLADGITRLAGGGIDLVLLDLSLPEEATGLEPLLRVREESPDVPVIVLTGAADDELAGQALQAGAQDYLTKGKLNPDLLGRSIRYAQQLGRLEKAMKSLSFMDGLTNLYNRRGFVTLAEPQIQLTQRIQGKFLTVSADITGLHQINEERGFEEGESVLRETAEILRLTFRDSDLIARLEGGGTFVVLAVDAPEETSAIIEKRLKQHVATFNGQTVRGYNLSNAARPTRA